ncbi:MAG: ornithine carbamoyltransferase, partial [Candidatus Desulfovibrio faecigallinarum]|nr:ornithine carbamoyltransferase [Candidatus Desulfovibrio faecigallinarum]
QFVYAGNSGRGMLSLEQINKWSLTRQIMSHAEDNAHVLLGTSPMRTIPIESEVLGSKNALILLQSENRLRVYKRMLHWLYEL